MNRATTTVSEGEEEEILRKYSPLLAVKGRRDHRSLIPMVVELAAANKAASLVARLYQHFQIFSSPLPSSPCGMLLFQSCRIFWCIQLNKVSILLGIFKLIMTGITILVVDKSGRRPLLLGGVSGLTISLFLLGAYYTFLGSAPVVALLFYVGCYQLSFGPIGWLIISEIFPLRMRGKGLSIAVVVNFGANALVTFSFSPLKALIGAGNVFFLFGVIAILALFFIFYVIPETKGLSLEEIEAKLL